MWTAAVSSVPARPSLSEIFAGTAADAASVGFTLSQLPRGQAPVLWVQDRVSRLESGVPYMPGLRGVDVVRVAVNQPRDVLWAMEEGLRCTALRAVLGEVWGDPAVLSFTASKRLALRAEASGVACFLLRRGAVPNLSAARARWRVSSLPSLPFAQDMHAPGTPRWDLELFRARDRAPGHWVGQYGERRDGATDHWATDHWATDHGATDRLHLIARSGDGPLDAGHARPQHRASG